jgi:hypothetical protein
LSRHYHVVENTPGYLPESEPACFRTKGEAENYAQSLADELRDQGYRVSGNKHNGYYAERDRNDLGRVGEILGVDGSECDV